MVPINVDCTTRFRINIKCPEEFKIRGIDHRKREIVMLVPYRISGRKKWATLRIPLPPAVFEY